MKRVHFSTIIKLYIKTMNVMYKPLEELYASIYNEIVKHKWVLSERTGTDVGVNAAERDWYARHFNDWSRYQKKLIFDSIN